MSPHPQIAEPLAVALADKGYETLTPVQEAVLEPGLEGEDLLVSAQTGSGKTVAFGLAFSGSVLQGEQRLPTPTAPLALIITPTRELALQVMTELRWLYGPAGGRITSCIGGMDMRDERRALERGVHIVVGTPGRLVDHIRRGSLDMQALNTVVLDEADEMLHMGFREELEHILTAAPVERRTLMFSATVSKPIARLAENYQNNAVRVNTMSTKSAHIDIEYQALAVSPADVEKAIINLLLFHDASKAIVFCSRREAVNKLTARLNNRGFSTVALSGEFSQKERSASLLAMRDGRARVCVATDVAARGIDLPGLDLVIHADLPRNKEALLHRSGRTGRAGRKGICALIVPFRARRRTERLLKDSGVEASWGAPPSAADIQIVQDQRLLNHDALTTPVQDDNNSDLTTALLDAFSAEQLATAVVRLIRAKDSAPEDLQALSEDAGRSERKSRKDRFSTDEGATERKSRDRRRSADFEDGAWVKLSIGRKGNADPKWLVPMLCKAGGFSRQSIGVIQIGSDVTHVELKPEAVVQLLDASGPDQIVDKTIRVDSTVKPVGDMEDGPDKTVRRQPKGPRRKKPDAAKKSAQAPKEKKKRIGPKKPRGPNGEKKRSKK